MCIFKVEFSRNEDAQTLQENASSSACDPISVFSSELCENADMYSGEKLGFTGVYFSTCSLKYKFRKNTYLLNFPRQRKYLVSCKYRFTH